ncbi:FKBP-type peptidyl-prolyl cis-trans isomerase [Pedobacter sp. AW31-3R]|uniref:FKBP-type peptidyl-prolyl cis-trans isomerase n=1 Tax=Pedobacter sp. AW31-3R TaxID=3445781 RepID=UPI003F9F428F
MLRKLSGFTLALLGLTVLLGSCKKDYESIQSVDATKIKDYIAKNNLTSMLEDPNKTGYYYQVLTEGTGDAYFTNTDTVLYDGVLKGLDNGTTYFTSPKNGNLRTFVGYTNTFNSFSIPAIRDVMTKLKPGGTARILLPSYLAFGKNGNTTYNISSNENIDLYITTYNENQADRDDRIIREYIAEKGLNTMIADESGVNYSITAVGDSAVIDRFSKISVAFTGRLLDGTVFDSSTSYSTILSSTIQGWIKTIPGKLKKGGKMRMLIPSRLGYGTSGNSGGSVLIPANAVLDFDVEITDVDN